MTMQIICKSLNYIFLFIYFLYNYIYVSKLKMYFNLYGEPVSVCCIYIEIYI